MKEFDIGKMIHIPPIRGEDIFDSNQLKTREFMLDQQVLLRGKAHKKAVQRVASVIKFAI